MHCLELLKNNYLNSFNIRLLIFLWFECLFEPQSQNQNDVLIEQKCKFIF